MSYFYKVSNILCKRGGVFCNAFFMMDSSAKIFSKLDANKGYWQIPLDENSIKLTTFNTPFGRYQYTRLPYGIHSAQEVFHKRVSQSFDGIQQVETDIDDILIWGQKDEDHDFQLIRCLEKAQMIGITMNINKCQFKAEELVYLVHKLTSNGVEPDEEKITSFKCWKLVILSFDRFV